MTAALPILAAQHWPGVLNLDVSNLAPPGGVGLVGVRKLIAAGWRARSREPGRALHARADPG